MVLALAVPARATEVFDCFDCVLGLWDDLGMTKTYGRVSPGETKEIYLGIHYGSGYTGLTGIEFSVAGIRPTDGFVVVGVDGVDPEFFRIGNTILAPVDTSATSVGTGGLNFAWSHCLAGDQPLVRITLLCTAQVENQVIEVKRKYPTSNRAWRTPILTLCDDPYFHAVRLTAGCYVMNWNGDPIPCLDIPVGTAPSTWTGVKALFR